MARGIRNSKVYASSFDKIGYHQACELRGRVEQQTRRHSRDVEALSAEEIQRLIHELEGIANLQIVTLSRRVADPCHRLNCE